MNWKEIYQSRTMSAQEALKKVPANCRMFLGQSMGEPQYLVNTMCDHKEWFTNVEITHMGSRGPHRYCNEPGMEGHFRHNSLFVSEASRQAIAEGRADFTPTFFSEIPKLIRSGRLKADVLLVQVAPPDEEGNVSLGLAVDYTKAALENADLVIAQVNDQYPFTYGGALVPVEKIHCFVEHSEPVLELPTKPFTEVEREIGRHCASLIEDGDTLQLGIGSIPDAVCSFLQEKKGLGIHTELMCDGVMKLMKAGIVTNENKVLDKGFITSAFAMGTREFYDFIDHNEKIKMMPVDYTNNVVNIAMQDHFVSINSAVEVDLMGQVCSESVGLRQISAVGGQVDFVRGSMMAAHGKSIIAIPSRAGKAKRSKIVATLTPGATVTTTKNDVDYVVTEYGIAHLRGLTQRDRAKALIAIAHPDAREELEKFYHQQYPNNSL